MNRKCKKRIKKYLKLKSVRNKQTAHAKIKKDTIFSMFEAAIENVSDYRLKLYEFCCFCCCLYRIQNFLVSIVAQISFFAFQLFFLLFRGGIREMDK